MIEPVRQLLLAERRCREVANVRRGAGRDEPVGPGGRLRGGLARIDANLGLGTYTVTEVWWDPDAEQWIRGEGPLALDAACAVDIAGNASGSVDQVVSFQELRALGGEVRVFVNVNPAGTDATERIGALTLHYSGTNTTGAYSVLSGVLNATLTCELEYRQCSGHDPGASHPGYAVCQPFDGPPGLTTALQPNRFMTWSGGGGWHDLWFMAYESDGTAHGPAREYPAGFKLQGRVSTGGTFEVRAVNGNAAAVSCVVVCTARAVLWPAPPGSLEVGNCCCHDDDWGS